jgi:hypothetical protein
MTRTEIAEFNAAGRRALQAIREAAKTAPAGEPEAGEQVEA